MMMIYNFAEAQPDYRKEGSHEWAIVYEGGLTFYTGGFDDLHGHMTSVKGGAIIAGTFDPRNDSYYETVLSKSYIAIVDLRSNTDSEDHR
jgi:hypothetical protein